MKKLPSKIKVRLCDLLDNWFDDELYEAINNYLADKYGFCNDGYCLDDTITISNINWDTTE